ncbi:alpha-2-macroglobulin receptor-associated protein-like [Argonauta hians]
MSHFAVFSVSLIFVLFCGSEAANKYLYDKQQLKVDANNLMYNAEFGRHFRMIKVQEMWTKAEKRLSGQPLADCYAALKVQDKLHFDLKWLKHKNKDKSMEKEVEVNKQLMAIAAKYDLGDFSDLNKSNIPNSARNKITVHLKSRPLKKLWKQAHYSGFTDDELEKLKEEFLKHQERLDEYDKMKDELSELEKVTHNNLGSDDEIRTAHRQYKNKNKEMKAIHKELHKNLEGLNRQVNEAKLDEDFSDFRVYQLYAMAKQTAMSEDELERFKGELKSFQGRITKHETLQEMVKQSKDHFDKTIDDGNYPKKHTDLVDKAKHYNHLVKKYHNELFKRVDNMIFKHTEL